MMTDEERRQLRQIERDLAADDPRLALLMSGRRYRRRPTPPLAWIVPVDIVAIAMLVLAVATGLLVLIFVSTLVTVLALSLHVIRRRARSV
jgi:hypothetical protein